MNRAEVGGAGSNEQALDNSITAAPQTLLALASICLMMVLEFAALALDISIVAHRIAAEVDAFLQHFLHGFEHEFEVRSRNF